MFQGVDPILSLDPCDKGSAVRRLIDQVNTGLIQCDRICLREYTDVVHIGLRRISVTVAVDRQAVHHVDIAEKYISRAVS